MNRPCKKCGRALSFVGNAQSGQLMPLDAATPVYAVCWMPNGEKVAIDVRELLASFKLAFHDTSRPDWRMEVDALAVSHFATCPHAVSFSKAKEAR